MKNSSDNDCQLTLCATKLRQNLSYCRDYILIGNFLVMVLLPLLLLGLLNGHIYHVLSQSSRRSSIKGRDKRDQRIATILVTIVIIFGCCNIPRVTINLFEVRLLLLVLFVDWLPVKPKTHILSSYNSFSTIQD